jgi:hypothetical protein
MVMSGDQVEGAEVINSIKIISGRTTICGFMSVSSLPKRDI